MLAIFLALSLTFEVTSGQEYQLLEGLYSEVNPIPPLKVGVESAVSCRVEERERNYCSFTLQDLHFTLGQSKVQSRFSLDELQVIQNSFRPENEIVFRGIQYRANDQIFCEGTAFLGCVRFLPLGAKEVSGNFTFDYNFYNGATEFYDVPYGVNSLDVMRYGYSLITKNEDGEIIRVLNFTEARDQYYFNDELASYVTATAGVPDPEPSTKV